MKKNSSFKYIILGAGCIALIVGAMLIVRDRYSVINSSHLTPESTVTSSVTFVSSSINASGVITVQNQATLNFQIAGKLTYLPFKAGDRVSEGQVLASLDTYALKKQLQLASNTYQTAKNAADQTQEYQKAGVLEGQQRYSLDTSNKQGYNSVTEATVIYDNVRRIVDNALLANNTAQINVDIANYALQLASLTSPLDGIITRQDVSVSGVNITPVTTFIVADPDSMVFRANVPASNIYYISEGTKVSLAIDGIDQKVEGTIVKIYPSKVTLSNGQTVYQVDIASEKLKKVAKLDQSGTAIITTNASNVGLVPSWTVLQGKYVWINTQNGPELREITAGKVHGNQIEILKGVSPEDKIIIDPKYISSHMYQLL